MKKSSNNADVKNYMSQVAQLNSEISQLKLRKAELEKAYREKEIEEQRASDTYKRHISIASQIYSMKKSRLTDKVAELIDAEANGENVKRIMDCYINVKSSIKQEISQINEDIEGKKKSVIKTQRKILNSVGLSD